MFLRCENIKQNKVFLYQNWSCSKTFDPFPCSQEQVSNQIKLTGYDDRFTRIPSVMFLRFFTYTYIVYTSLSWNLRVQHTHTHTRARTHTHTHTHFVYVLQCSRCPKIPVKGKSCKWMSVDVYQHINIPSDVKTTKNNQNRRGPYNVHSHGIKRRQLRQ